MKKTFLIPAALLTLFLWGVSCNKTQQVVEPTDPELTFAQELSALANSPDGKLHDKLPDGYKPVFSKDELNYEKVVVFERNDGKFAELYWMNGKKPEFSNRRWTGYIYGAERYPNGTWTGSCVNTGMNCGYDTDTGKAYLLL